MSALISKTLKLDKNVWLKNLTKLEGLLPFAENEAFRAEWAAIKQRKKERVAHYVRTTLGLDIRTDAMFDVQIKVSWPKLAKDVVFVSNVASASTNINIELSTFLELSMCVITTSSQSLF